MKSVLRWPALILLFLGSAHAAAQEIAVAQRITFEGFAANEVYPADINQDGRLELLCLQSPGLYQSEVYNTTRYHTQFEMRNIFCLTAITLEGKVLWQFGEPCLKFRLANSHTADQMIWYGLIADKNEPELAVLRKNSLLILDPATGAIKRSTDLGADNYVIVVRIHTRKGNRLLIQNTDAGYAPYGYGLPALIYDASDLRLIATISDAVGSGHSPRALDINGDGDDEILIGFDAYDADGKRLWRLAGEHRDHVDQLQVGRFGSPATSAMGAIVYAASKDVEMGTLTGELLWKQDFGHPQHVVLGSFRSGNKSACMAVYCCRNLLGTAQKEFLKQSGIPAPRGDRTLDNIAFLDERGNIVSLVFPALLKYHSGEGILVYPQGCPDGSDVVVTRDWGWPQALDMAGETPFVFPQPEGKPEPEAESPVGPGPDGYGVRIADFDNDRRAEILIHDQTGAWIYKPPYPRSGVPNTHRKLEPVTGQGLYGYTTSATEAIR